LLGKDLCVMPEPREINRFFKRMHGGDAPGREENPNQFKGFNSSN